MKSTNDELRKRGMPTETEIISLSKLVLSELVTRLQDADSSIRSAAAVNMRSFTDEAADELLLQLSNEKCLYTRLAICDTLESGSLETARKMTEYLGKIGNNQHKVVPDKVSAKKSFPLPRDIIARSLGKMDVSVFPVLIEVIDNNKIEQVSEVLDAIGYMVFYHSDLATEKNCEKIISLAAKYASNSVVLWKIILCLSAFPCKESKEMLLRYINHESTLGFEARRSLKFCSTE